jgi:pimeloyl-ACP methyl ester carboxylesterase
MFNVLFCYIFYKLKVMREKLVKKDGVVICTESFGEKENPAILLSAGATVSMLFWDEEFCKRLAEKGFFVIRYDNRDVGKSTNYEPGTTPYDIVDLVNDAITILDGYKVEKAHFVGVSLGGLVSQIAALEYSNRIESLTLMATGPWGDSDPDIPEMDTRILDFHAKAASVDWSDEENVVQYLLEGSRLMSGQKPFDKDRAEKTIRAEFRRANNYISMFNHAILQGGETYYNRLNEIEQPVLIIHGSDDLIWHFKHALVLERELKNSKLMVLEGTGHELHYQDWDTIIDGITSFLSDLEKN